MKVKSDKTHGRGWFVYCGGNKYLHLDGVVRVGIYFLGKENVFWNSRDQAEEAISRVQMLNKEFQNDLATVGAAN